LIDSSFMTFSPEWLTGNANLNTSNAFHKWVYLTVSPWFLESVICSYWELVVHECHVRIFHLNCPLFLMYLQQMGLYTNLAHDRFLPPHCWCSPSQGKKGMNRNEGGGLYTKDVLQSIIYYLYLCDSYQLLSIPLKHPTKQEV
jgi:hypothetical protein